MQRIRVGAAFLGCSSIMMTVSTLWIAKTFGHDIYLEQMLWHLAESSLEGVDQIYIKRAAKFSALTLALCVVWMIACYPRPLIEIFRKLPFLGKYFSDSAVDSRKYSLLLLCASSIYFIGIGIFVDERFHIHEYICHKVSGIAEISSTRGSDELKNMYSIPSRDEILFEKKQSMVIVLAESMETSFNDPQLERPLMPRMEKLKKLSQHNDNYVKVYGAGWTIASMTGWFFGLPLRVPHGIGANSYRAKTGFLPGAESIFDILKENGYELVFILGSSRFFSGKDKLFFGHGEFVIMDKEYFEKQGWSVEADGGTGWGFTDAFVFERALEEYQKLKAAGKPFVLFIETVDTHGPDGFCPPERRQYNDFRDAVVELDRNLAEFSQKIWNDDVVYIVLGDHFLMGNPDFLKPVENRKIFNLFHGNLPSIPADKRGQHVSALDMAPTLLHAAGARWTGDQFGLGISLFSERPSLLEEYGLERFNEFLGGWSPFYSTLYEKRGVREGETGNR